MSDPERVLVDENVLAFIAHADPEDDWTLEATARKSESESRHSRSSPMISPRFVVQGARIADRGRGSINRSD